MPAYHSTFLAEEQNQSINSGIRTIGNLSLLPFHTNFRGPIYSENNSDYDIIEEVLDLFRANSFFKNFEIKGNSDRLLIYGILFINQCLTKLTKFTNSKEATKILINLSVDNFHLPGDIGFPLNSLYVSPANKSEYELLKNYLTQFRQELSDRLIKRIYHDDPNMPSKHWLAFTKRKFMNKSL